MTVVFDKPESLGKDVRLDTPAYVLASLIYLY